MLTITTYCNNDDTQKLFLKFFIKNAFDNENDNYKLIKKVFF